MKKNISLVIVVALFGQSLFAALPQKNKSDKEQTALYQELTGRSTQAPNKILASADKALVLARQSRKQKNYILAIKRYNFIMKYYSKTPFAKVALSDKVSLYKEMGLTEQANYNQNKVLQISKTQTQSLKTSAQK